jgi:hypothetical protein
MGDRASIELRYPAEEAWRPKGGSVFIYLHWLAHETPAILTKAIEREGKGYDDHDYFAAVIMREIVRAAGIDDNMSMGVGPTYADGVKWVVDLKAQTISPPNLDSPWDRQTSATPISYADFVASVKAGKDYGYGL